MTSSSYICTTEEMVVLLLDTNYLPWGISSAKEGIRKLISSANKARPSVYSIASDGEIVSWDRWSCLDDSFLYNDQPYMRTASQSFPVPTILLTTDNFGYRVKKYTPSLKTLYVHYKGNCQICGKHHHIRDMTIEHIYPKSKGGTKESHNVTMTCKPCNNKKGSLYPYTNSDGKPLKGYTPSPVPSFGMSREEWAPYLFRSNK